MSHTVTPEAFRRAHPELASRSWLDGDTICIATLSGKVERLRCFVPLCDSCDQPLRKGVCGDCDTLSETVSDPMSRRAA